MAFLTYVFWNYRTFPQISGALFQVFIGRFLAQIILVPIYLIVPLFIIHPTLLDSSPWYRDYCEKYLWWQRRIFNINYRFGGQASLFVPLIFDFFDTAYFHELCGKAILRGCKKVPVTAFNSKFVKTTGRKNRTLAQFIFRSQKISKVRYLYGTTTILVKNQEIVLNFPTFCSPERASEAVYNFAKNATPEDIRNMKMAVTDIRALSSNCLDLILALMDDSLSQRKATLYSYREYADDFLGPILEEHFKDYCRLVYSIPYAGACFACFEFCRYAYFEPQNILQRVGPVMLHISTDWVPLPVALFVHVLWNCTHENKAYLLHTRKRRVREQKTFRDELASTLNYWIYASAAGAFWIAIFCKQFLIAAYLNAIFLAPFVEEAVKNLVSRFLPFAHQIFAIIEFFLYMRIEGVRWYHRIPAFYMHCVTSFMHLDYSLFLHSSFNFFAVTFWRLFQGSMSSCFALYLYCNAYVIYYIEIFEPNMEANEELNIRTLFDFVKFILETFSIMISQLFQRECIESDFVSYAEVNSRITLYMVFSHARFEEEFHYSLDLPDRIRMFCRKYYIWFILLEEIIVYFFGFYYFIGEFFGKIVHLLINESLWNFPTHCLYLLSNVCIFYIARMVYAPFFVFKFFFHLFWNEHYDDKFTGYDAVLDVIVDAKDNKYSQIALDMYFCIQHLYKHDYPNFFLYLMQEKFTERFKIFWTLIREWPTDEAVLTSAKSFNILDKILPQRVVQSKQWSTFTTFICSLFGSSIFKETRMYKWALENFKPIVIGFEDDFNIAAINFGISVSNFFKKLVSGESIRNCFDINPLIELRRLYVNLRVHDFSNMSEDEMVNTLGKVWETIKEVSSKATMLTMEENKMYDWLLGYWDANNKIFNSLKGRSMPFPVFLVGPPGTGKTTIMLQILNFSLNIMQAKRTPGDVVSVNINDKHPAETCTSNHVKGVCVNDVPAVYSDFPMQDRVPLDLFIQQILDTATFAFKSASLANKAKIHNEIQSVLFSSNYYSYLMEQDTEKLVRRLNAGMVLAMFVMKADGTAYTDKELADSGLSDDERSARTKLMVMDPLSHGKHLTFAKTRTLYSLPEFFKVLGHRIIKHMDKNKKIEEMIENKCSCQAFVNAHYQMINDVPTLVRIKDECDLEGLVDTEGIVPSSAIDEAQKEKEINSIHEVFRMKEQEENEEAVAKHLGVKTKSDGDTKKKKKQGNIVLTGISSHVDHAKATANAIFNDFKKKYKDIVDPVVVEEEEIVDDRTVYQKVKEGFFLLFVNKWFLSFSAISWFCLYIVSLSFMYLFNNYLVYASFIAIYVIFRGPWFFRLIYSGNRTFDLLDFIAEEPLLPTSLLNGLVVVSSYVRWRRFQYEQKNIIAMLVGVTVLAGSIITIFFRQNQKKEEKQSEGNVVLTGEVPVRENTDTETMWTMNHKIVTYPKTEEKQKLWQRKNDFTHLKPVKQGFSAEVLEKICLERLNMFYKKADPTKKALGHIFILNQQFAVINAHYIKAYKETIKIYKYETELDVRDCYFVNNSEVVLFRHAIPGVFPDLTPHLIQDDLTYHHLGRLVRTPEWKKDAEGNKTDEMYLSRDISIEAVLGCGEAYRFPHLQYENPDAKVGDCGQVVLSAYQNMYQISAFVFAMQETSSIQHACFLRQHDVAAAYRYFDEPVSDVDMSQFEKIQLRLTGDMSEMAAFTEKPSPYIKLLGSEDGKKSSFNTQLRPSKLHLGLKQNMIKDFTIPPPTVKGVVKETGEYSSSFLTTFANINLHTDVSIAESLEALNAFHDEFSWETTNASPLTLEEAMFGCPGQSIDRINFNTSLGMTQDQNMEALVNNASVGLILKERGFRDKKDLFRLEDGKFYFDKRTAVEINVMIQRLKTHIVPPIIELIHKDEIREKSKFDKFKIRLFSVVDFRYNIIMRMYVLPLIQVHMMDRQKSECVGSINAASQEWETLATEIFQTSYKYFDLDGVAFDAAQCAVCFRTIAIRYRKNAQRCGWPKEACDIVYNVIFSLCIQLVRFNGDWVTLHKRLPSGVIITLKMNSDINSRNSRIVFKRITGMEMIWFKFYITIRTLGDDFLGALHMKIRRDFPDFLNDATDQLLKMGFETTSGDKTGKARFLDKEEIVFLKRKFARHPEMNCIVAPLATDSIWKALCFEPKNAKPSCEHRISQVYEDGQREFFLYGKAEFQKFQSIVKKVNDDLPYFARYHLKDLEFDDLVEKYQSDVLFMTSL